MRLYKKFQKAKEEKGPEGIVEFTKKENLVDVDLEFLFEKFMANEQKINNFMKMYSFSERCQIQIEYEEAEANEAAQLAIIERYDLFGALPSFWPYPTQAEINSL